MYLKQALFNRQMSVPTFWLDPESSKEVKAAPASLLTPSIPLESRKLALRAQTAELPDASFRSFALRSPAEANLIAPLPLRGAARRAEG